MLYTGRSGEITDQVRLDVCEYESSMSGKISLRTLQNVLCLPSPLLPRDVVLLELFAVCHKDLELPSLWQNPLRGRWPCLVLAPSATQRDTEQIPGHVSPAQSIQSPPEVLSRALIRDACSLAWVFTSWRGLASLAGVTHAAAGTDPLAHAHQPPWD